MNDRFEHALRDLSDGDMVGITIQNRVNQFPTQSPVSGISDMESLLECLTMKL